jgi:hypothetical protein
MREYLAKTAAGCALVVICLVTVIVAQAPAQCAGAGARHQPPGALQSAVVANPITSRFPLEITVNRLLPKCGNASVSIATSANGCVSHAPSRPARMVK